MLILSTILPLKGGKYIKGDPTFPLINWSVDGYQLMGKYNYQLHMFIANYTLMYLLNALIGLMIISLLSKYVEEDFQFGLRDRNRKLMHQKWKK